LFVTVTLILFFVKLLAAGLATAAISGAGVGIGIFVEWISNHLKYNLFSNALTTLKANRILSSLLKIQVGHEKRREIDENSIRYSGITLALIWEQFFKFIVRYHAGL
jgi:hypothetical protein